ncbi:Peptide transporter PTR2, partial [Monoraphidium neglectum]
MAPQDDMTVVELEEHFGEKKGGDLDAPVPGRKTRVTAACSCILGNEICERLAYYGLQTNMGLYLKQYMGYPADTASQLLQAWKGTVYLTPLLGAFLADSYLGRHVARCATGGGRTLPGPKGEYLIGMGGVTAVNLIPSMRPNYQAAPASGDFGPTRGMFWAFLYLVALGSGGIKPCVSSFGGDQVRGAGQAKFREDSKRERGWRSSFFNWFYFAINIGSLVATLVVVPVQESKGYGIGFGIPTAAMGAAILVFVFGALIKIYTFVPPEGSPFFRIWKVLRGAWINRKLTAPADVAELYEPAAGEKSNVKFRMAHTKRMAALDKAAIRSPAAGAAAAGGRRGYQVSLTEVEETKSFMSLMPVFLTVIIWQMAYDPIFSLLPYPGDVMDRRLGNSNFKIPASSISFANTFGVLLTIPL